MRRLVVGVASVLLAVAVPVGWGASPAPRLAVWAEASANLQTLSTRAGVAAILDKAKAAGVTAIVPEAKNAWGFVTYDSAFAPHIRTSPVPRTSGPAYPAPNTWYPPGYDQLRVIIEEAHARGLEVHAAINVFGEGLNPFRVGSLFERPEWQALHVGPGGRLPASAVGTIAFANPALTEVQLYELAILAEVVNNYDVDGIVLDRIRYPDITADVSDSSRETFERWLGRPVARWPDDVLRLDGTRLVRGPVFREWVAWRAQVIHQFVRAARTVVKTLKPGIAFAAYVGGWYPAYWNEGTNWASAAYEPSSIELVWATAPWRQATVAPFFDYLLVGLYYPAISQRDALRSGQPLWASVEGGALLAQEALAGATRPVGGLLLTLYEGQPQRFRAALASARRLTAGAMLFDLVYLEQYGWWDYLNEVGR